MAFISKEQWYALLYLAGITIGAGVLTLPYVFEQAGMLVGTIELVGMTVIVLLVTLYLAEIVLRTKGHHEVTGLAEIYLGKKGKFFLVAVSIFYIYGAIIAYITGLGDALEGIIGVDPFVGGMIVFFIVAALVFFGLKEVTRAEVLLTPFIFFIILFLFFTTFSQINTDNYLEVNKEHALMPLGPLFFAMLGFWCVPEMRKIIKDDRKLKQTIIWGVCGIGVTYFFLIFIVVGITGENTTPIFSEGVTTHIGQGIGILLHLFAFFTLITSFIGLSFTLKEMYEIDYRLNNTIAWGATFAVPFLFLLFVQLEFLQIIILTGGIASVFVLLVVVIMFHQAKKYGKRRPEFSLPVPLWANILIMGICLFMAIQILLKYAG